MPPPVNGNWGRFRELKILHSKRFLCIPPLALIISNGLWAVSWIESLSIIVLSITGDRTSLKKLLWSLSPVMPMLFPRPNTNFRGKVLDQFLDRFLSRFLRLILGLILAPIKHNYLVNYRRQDVFEKAVVEPFTCYADAFPKAKYYWSFEEGNFTTVGSTLTFRHGIRRYQVHYISVVRAAL